MPLEEVSWLGFGDEASEVEARLGEDVEGGLVQVGHDERKRRVERGEEVGKRASGLLVVTFSAHVDPSYVGAGLYTPSSPPAMRSALRAKVVLERNGSGSPSRTEGVPRAPALGSPFA